MASRTSTVFTVSYWLGNKKNLSNESEVVNVTLHKPVALISIAAFMICVLVWAWRFPGSEEEYEKRIKEGKKIGWTK